MRADWMDVDVGDARSTKTHPLRPTKRLERWVRSRRLHPVRFEVRRNPGANPRRCAAHEERRYAVSEFVLLILFGGLSYHRATACDCVLDESRLCADAIFVGEIVEQDPDVESEPASTVGSGQSSMAFRRFNFQVLRSLRGIDRETVGIMSDSSDCGLYGNVGDKLLVYAARDPATGLLTTQECWVRRYSDPPLDDRPDREIEALRALGLDELRVTQGDDLLSPPFDFSPSVGRPLPALCGTGVFPLVAGLAMVFPIVRLRLCRASGRRDGMSTLGAAGRRPFGHAHGGAALGHATHPCIHRKVSGATRRHSSTSTG